MATNWNAVLANINNSNDILAILKKILPLLDGKVDSTTIDEVIAQLNKIAEDGQITIDEALETINFLEQKIDEKTNAFNDAIEAAAAAGAGANGWTATLVADASGQNQQLINNLSLLGVASIDALRLTTPFYKGHKVTLISANEGQQEGGGEFVATKKNGLVDDGGTIIASPVQDIFWVRINYDRVTPEMFGYDNTDGAISIQKTLNSNLPVSMLAKEYLTSKPLVIPANIKLIGAGVNKTTVRKTTGTPITTNTGTYDCCVLVEGDRDGYIGNLNIDSISFKKDKVLGVESGSCALFKFLMRSSFSSIYFYGGETGVKVVDGWMVNWTRVESMADIPFDFDTGTSNTFVDCWARIGKTYAWKIHNLTYSTMLNSGADYTGADGTPADAVFKISNSHLSLVSCGCEQTHAYNLIHADYSWLSIINPHMFDVHNKYFHQDLARQGVLCATNPDTVFKISGGEIVLNYNDETTIKGVRPYSTDGSISDFDNVVFYKDISSIEDINWGFNLRGAHVTSFKAKGQEIVLDNRFPQSDSRSASKTNKQFAFKYSDVANTDLNTLRNKDIKFCFAASDSFSNAPKPNFVGHVINMSFGNTDLSSNHSNQIAASINSNDIYWRRAGWGEGFNPWFAFWHSGNSTVDGNGFIKAASPIVKLFADHVSLNDEAAEQNITFEKVSLGSYLVKGSSGFAKEGWYIETPKDANGNILFAVQYQQLENNDIEIKTFKKKFDFESASIVADLDNPVDIPSGRWIDLRLQVVLKPVTTS